MQCSIYICTGNRIGSGISCISLSEMMMTGGVAGGFDEFNLTTTRGM